MIYYIDIDGTICEDIPIKGKTEAQYRQQMPYTDRINRINQLYDDGHEIKYMTARGAVSKVDYYELTKNQLESWGAKYTELSVGEKEHYDVWIDDKAFWSENFFRQVYQDNTREDV